MPSLSQWIAQQKQPDFQWLQRYLAQKGHPIGGSGHGFTNALSSWEKAHPDLARDKEFLRELRGAWAQKIYRQSKDRASCSMVLKKKSKERLMGLAQAKGMSMGQVVETLLTEPSIATRDWKPEQGQQKPQASPAIKASHQKTTQLARALGELLLDTLTDLAILKLQMAQLGLQDTKIPLPSIPAIVKTADEHLHLRCKEDGVSGFNVKRSLAQRRIIIDNLRVERRLDHENENTKVLRRHSVTRRLAATKLPVPNASLINFEHRSQVIERVTHPNWLTLGAKLVITGEPTSKRVWLACAIAGQHCEAGASVRYYRAMELVFFFDSAESPHRYQLIHRFSNSIDLLVIDGWDEVPWTPEQLQAMNELLEARESQGGTIVVSSVPIRVWASSQEPVLLTRSVVGRLGGDTEQLLVKPGFTYNPNTGTTQIVKDADTMTRSKSGMPKTPAALRAPMQIFQIEGDRIYPPESPESRREPAITYELELGTLPPGLSEYPAAKDRVEDEAFELMSYTQGPGTPAVETKINQKRPELPEDPESKNNTTPKPE